MIAFLLINPEAAVLRAAETNPGTLYQDLRRFQSQLYRLDRDILREAAVIDDAITVFLIEFSEQRFRRQWWAGLAGDAGRAERSGNSEDHENDDCRNPGLVSCKKSQDSFDVDSGEFVDPYRLPENMDPRNLPEVTLNKSKGHDFEY